MSIPESTPALLFLHIPKTGGTSLDSGWLQQRFARASRFCETDLFKNGVLKSRHVFYEMEQISKNYKFPFKEVCAFYASQGLVPLDRDYYAAHICFGFHRVLDRPCRYVTLLRHPVERIISWYNLIHSLGRPTGTFAEFLSSGQLEVDNYQVRCLCEDGWTGRKVTQAMLEEAQDNLMHHCAFGVTDRLNQSLESIARRLELPPPPQPLHLNRTVESAPIHCGAGKAFHGIVKDISAAQRDEILAQNQWDGKLHAFASARLESTISPLAGAYPLPRAKQFWSLGSWLRRPAA